MISVIIPAYNAQAYLRQCLESVLAQSYSDWEAIIVNDGSTDPTLDIALSYATLDQRFRVITTDNRGVSSARNTALAEAKGEWVTFLDSDDMLPPDALMAYMNVPAPCDVIAGQWSRELKSGMDAVTSACCYREAIMSGLYQTGSISTVVGAKLYRREIFAKVSFAENLRYEDLLFFVDALSQVKEVTVISDIVYLYRDNTDSFINTFSPRRLDVLRITRMIEEACAGDPELSRAARDRRLSANFNIYGLLSVHDRRRRYDDVRQQCWQLIKSYRLDSLLNPRVRLKNKLGILVSYFGQTAMDICAKILYR